ncbi:hypothetical protein QN372_01240 [Undibacterium sp. RTI2.1]|uniref:hypothetical protein n=1 Tax=unclassified Undibacterium TaxID=2630295 RepID=UPI002B233FCE|nr:MULTISPECIES: hypothetical protein [unclassified Undibacterium]MEB0029362.1 hypothetical protein [Undibacterium sp. RTI2.1]MEB0116020.1 hypothetical protein [Undibacterium sp. RTI2.2]
MKKSEYGTAFVMLLLALFVELPVSSLAFGFIITDPIERHWAHILIIVTSIYTLILVLGDRWKLRQSHHQIDNDFLYLRCADRFIADIPLDQVKSVDLFNDDLKKWKDAKHKLKQTFEIVSPFAPLDKPNLVIELVESLNLKIKRNCQLKPSPRFILLYVDEPSRSKSIISDALSALH